MPETEMSQPPDRLEFKDVCERLGGAAGMWKKLRGVSTHRAYLDVALLVKIIAGSDFEWLLRELGELPLDEDAAREEAIRRGDLVLGRVPPTLHWKGTLVKVDWIRHRASWEFFLTACEHTKRNEAIDRFSFGEKAHQNVVTQKKSRLKSLRGFPIALIKSFKSVGNGTQRLMIPPENIHIFHVSDI